MERIVHFRVRQIGDGIVDGRPADVDLVFGLSAFLTSTVSLSSISEAYVVRSGQLTDSSNNRKHYLRLSMLAGFLTGSWPFHRRKQAILSSTRHLWRQVRSNSINR